MAKVELGPAKLNLFMKEMKNYFRTSYINKLTFSKIFILYEDVAVYKECMATLKDLFYNPETAKEAGAVAPDLTQGSSSKLIRQRTNHETATSARLETSAAGRQ